MKSKIWLGAAISVFFVWLAFRKIDYNQLWSGLSNADYIYIAPAILLTIIQYYLRAVRWGYIVEPIKKVPMYSLFSSISIGYMANNILPARIGEFVRAYVLAKGENLPVSSTFATIVIERIVDVLTVFVFMLVVLRLIDLPPERALLGQSLQLWGGAAFSLFLIMLGILFYLKNHKDTFIRFVETVMKPVSVKAARKLAGFMESFADGLLVLKRDKHIFLIALHSLLIWVIAATPVYLIFLSFGYSLPFSVSLFILVIVAFAVAIPSAPGFVGTFHYAVAVGLGMFNVPPEEALSVAIILHAINFFPITIIGLFFLWKEKVSLKEAERLEEGVSL